MESLIFEAPTYVDYTWLMHSLSDYASPRAKVTTLLASGDLIRIKKGLYIAGAKYHKNWSRGVIANRIYGPSYLSYEYALSWYGLIPERVENLSSATLKPGKEFVTPIGTFLYTRISSAVFYHSVDMVEEAGSNFLMATPEKALADTIARNKSLSSLVDIDSFCISDMRIDRSDLAKMDSDRMSAIAGVYAQNRVTLLSEYIEQIRRSPHE